ncbi:MAG: hypothetical protein J0H89_12465 [Rhizobiales bacterium]|jgi:hypothetical protein|nr:hypothetical protein [Hyphomicrobiales bacterium]
MENSDRRHTQPRVRFSERTLRRFERRQSNDETLSADKKSHYEVGYGKPPLHTRFKPGVSGNPRGRRKKPLDMRRDIQQEFLRPIRVRDGDKTIPISTIVFLFRRLLNEAAKGNVRCALAVAKLANQFGVYQLAEQQQEVDLSKLSLKDRAKISEAVQIFFDAKISTPYRPIAERKD